VTVGASFIISVMIDEASDFGGFQFELLYISTTVTVDDVRLGDFLGSTGRYTIALGPKIDNDAGKVTFGAASYGVNLGPDGIGTLALITFTGREEGVSALELQGVWLVDSGGNPQTLSVEHGWVKVVRPRPIGGIIVPVNRLELLAPWMGLVAMAWLGTLTVVLVKRRVG
jgi:hypothetical protein